VSDNTEILIIWHLKRVVSRPEIYFIPEEKKSFINERGIYQGHVVLSPSPLSPGPSTSSTNKTPENINEDPADLNQHRMEISKQILLCLAVQPKYLSSNKIIPVKM
jgi:hypothetical protein